jgi:hypothetical protein
VLSESRPPVPLTEGSGATAGSAGKIGPSGAVVPA